jgi:hypothetical protein
MHGIFPTHNKYYIRTEIFPHLTKKEMKDVYYPAKKPKSTGAPRKIKSPEVEE